MPSLADNIQFVQGAGPQRAEILAKELKIVTVEDLLYYFPYKHIDRTKFYSIYELHSDLPYIQIKGHFTSFKTIGEGRAKRLTAVFSDETGGVEIVWFKGAKWILEKIKTNVEYVLFGKPSRFQDRLNIVHPEIEESRLFSNSLSTSLQPQYNLTEKLRDRYISSKTIQKLIESAWSKFSNLIVETLPQSIISDIKLMPLKMALFQIHFPENEDLLLRARFRLKFEELFAIQLKLVYDKTLREHNIQGYTFNRKNDNVIKKLYESLPFTLTDAQIRVLGEIRVNVSSGRQMNRLLQGDVGSGKTLVALFSMLMAVDNGYQACIMVPTEILAKQHFETIKEFLKDLPVEIGLLTGSTKKKERTVLHNKLMSGEISILIGTHALIENAVQFLNLGFVVIDEQHRFGVAQRAKLWAKSSFPPHVLIMTATPIPRTLAMTLYGDLDVSVIDELPPGRKPIKTIHLFDKDRLTLFQRLKEQLALGRQAYVVFPLIKESEKLNYKDLEDGYHGYARAFPPPDTFITVVHGKMKAAEKEQSMAYFINGQSSILIATTVIEVGVNIPNATIMIIESSERFGLSQLHQLRGRVGRGADQSYCYLMSGSNLSNDTYKRLEAMVNSTDGFELAELDMKLRGPGDIDGTQQSGMPINLRIANLSHDNKILELAREKAKTLLANDPQLISPENYMLRAKLIEFKTEIVDWSKIS